MTRSQLLGAKALRILVSSLFVLTLIPFSKAPVSVRADGPVVLVKDIYPGVFAYAHGGPTLMGAIGSSLLFSVEDGNGRELWKSDGTAAGTVMIKAPLGINPVSGAGSSPAFPCVVGGIMYFAAED